MVRSAPARKGLSSVRTSTTTSSSSRGERGRERVNSGSSSAVSSGMRIVGSNRGGGTSGASTLSVVGAKSVHDGKYW